MASATKQTEFRRKIRRKNMGRARKAQARIHGTTPSFPIHTPAADDNAPAAQLSPAAQAE
jgi:hypothetical protein